MVSREQATRFIKSLRFAGSKGGRLACSGISVGNLYILRGKHLMAFPLIEGVLMLGRACDWNNYRKQMVAFPKRRSDGFD